MSNLALTAFASWYATDSLEKLIKEYNDPASGLTQEGRRELLHSALMFAVIAGYKAAEVKAGSNVEEPIDVFKRSNVTINPEIKAIQYTGTNAKQIKELLPVLKNTIIDYDSYMHMSCNDFAYPGTWILYIPDTGWYLKVPNDVFKRYFV